jgi:Coenzyme PQQ synthesis protein D (PqqD)
MSRRKGTLMREHEVKNLDLSTVPREEIGSFVVQPTQHQISLKMGDEEVILDHQSGEYYGLNATGAHIWQLLKEQKTIHEICDILLEEYDTTQETCEQYLIQLFQQLLDEGLVEIKTCQDA